MLMAKLEQGKNCYFESVEGTVLSYSLLEDYDKQKYKKRNSSEVCYIHYLKKRSDCQKERKHYDPAGVC